MGLGALPGPETSAVQDQLAAQVPAQCRHGEEGEMVVRMKRAGWERGVVKGSDGGLLIRKLKAKRGR